MLQLSIKDLEKLNKMKIDERTEMWLMQVPLEIVLWRLFHNDMQAASNWVQAVYHHPQMSSVIRQMDQLLDGLNLETLHSMLTIFERGGLVYGIKYATEWFWRSLMKSYGQSYGLEILTIHEVDNQAAQIMLTMDAPMMAVHLLQDGELVENQLVYRSDVCDTLSIREVLECIAHETWHGSQAVSRAEMYRKHGRKGKIILPADVKQADRAMLYTLNVAIHFDGMGGKTDYDCYRGQILEREAFTFESRLDKRLDALGVQAEELVWRLNTRVSNVRVGSPA